jgi:hypothetical protein
MVGIVDSSYKKKTSAAKRFPKRNVPKSASCISYAGSEMALADSIWQSASLAQKTYNFFLRMPNECSFVTKKYQPQENAKEFPLNEDGAAEKLLTWFHNSRSAFRNLDRGVWTVHYGNAFRRGSRSYRRGVAAGEDHAQKQRQGNYPLHRY